MIKQQRNEVFKFKKTKQRILERNMNLCVIIQKKNVHEINALALLIFKLNIICA